MSKLKCSSFIPLSGTTKDKQNSNLINVLIFTAFFFVSLGQLGRVSLINQQVNFHLYEIVLFLLMICLFVRYRFKPIAWSLTKVKSFYFFAVLMVFSVFISLFHYSSGENLIAILYLIRLIGYFIFFFYLRFYAKEIKNKKILFNGLAIFIGITVLTSLVQYIFYPDLRNLFYLGWDPHLYRLFGLFFDTSIGGVIYGMIFIYLLIDKPFKNKVINLTLLFTFFVFIVLTFSRSLYLALSICIFIILMKNKSYKSFIFYLLFFIFFVMIVPKPFGEGVNLLRISSIESRSKNYFQAINIWKKNPLFGIGYNHIRYEKIKSGVDEKDLLTSHAGASFHSSFLIILVTGGIVGLIGFLWLLYQLSKLNSFLQVLIVFLSLLSLSDNIILHPFVLFILFNFILFDK